MDISKEKLDQILEEISGYEVNLAEDPTLPTLGTKYLQKVLSQCRSFLNRVTYYLQLVKRYERRLKTDIKQKELDLDFKLKEKLADDPLVKRQASFEDRKALAISMLKDEYEALGTLQVTALDTDETYKIIKSKHLELTRTNADIRTQRNLVKDDMLARMSGQEGYIKPQVQQDRSIPEGLPPPVSMTVNNLQDILPPGSKAEDFPQPLDSQHAQQIQEFLSRNPIREQQPVEKPTEEPPTQTGIDYSDLLV